MWNLKSYVKPPFSKYILWAAVFVLVLTIPLVCFAAEDIQVGFNAVSCQPNENITLNLALNNVSSVYGGVYSADFKFHYDNTKFELVSISKGSIVPEGTGLFSESGADTELAENPGSVKLSVYGLSDVKFPITADGELARIVFKVKPDVVPGTYQITFDSANCSITGIDGNAELVDSLTSGEITVQQVTPPDEQPKDMTPPILTGVSSGPLAVGEAVYATSNENGFIYLVTNSTQNNQAALDEAVINNTGVKTAVYSGATAALSTIRLVPGIYVVYAADANGNLSPASPDITITDDLSLEGVSVNVAAGLLTNTLESMEYSVDSTDGIDGTWVACTPGTTSVSFTPGKVFVRLASLHSHYRQIAVLTIRQAPDITGVGYDIAAGTITGTMDTLQYQLNGGNWTDVTPGGNTKAVFVAGTLKFRVKATESELPSEEALKVTIAQPAAAPNLSANDGSNTISGLNASYEYKIDSGSWVSGGVAGNFAGRKTVYIRLKATQTLLASESQVIQFTANYSASLVSLVLSTGTLSPAFSSDTTSYTVNVGNNVKAITITPVQLMVGSEIRVNGSVVSSRTPSRSITLNVGSNTINIEVTASDGVTSRNYKVTVKRAAASSTTSGSTITTGNANVTSTVPGSIQTTTAAAASGQPAGFVDINGHWAMESINRLRVSGIVYGNPDGTFRPEEHITRGEATAILVRALKLKPATEADLAQIRTFADFGSMPEWVKENVAIAVREGLIKGQERARGQLVFESGKPLNRCELAAITARIIESRPDIPSQSDYQFADSASIPAWARDSLSVAVGSGIISGYPDDTFRPNKEISRAETATIVVRLLNQLNLA